MPGGSTRISGVTRAVAAPRLCCHQDLVRSVPKDNTGRRECQSDHTNADSPRSTDADAGVVADRTLGVAAPQSTLGSEADIRQTSLNLGRVTDAPPAGALVALMQRPKIEANAVGTWPAALGLQAQSRGVLCVVEGTRRVGQTEDTLQWHPMRREHLGSDVVAARIEKPVSQPMHILDQLSQVKVDEVLVELIERRISIQVSGDLVAQDAKIGLEGDISICV